jgi:serine/threonine protein phosphatase PrpC
VQKGKKIDFSIEEVRKMQVCPIPDIKKIPLQNDYDFMIIACDGIWDVYKNEEAVELAFMTREAIKNKKVSKKIKAQYPDGVIPLQISKIIEKIMSKGMAETSLGLSKPRGLGTDNMSCIILEFKPGWADGATPDPEIPETEPGEVEEPENKDDFLSMIDIPKNSTAAPLNATGEAE